jgi:AcrR family transcriptional regulator
VDTGEASRRRGLASRARLVEAAVELIAERGWLGVTTRRVAERAGVNAGLVHYHFGSVENLRRAAAVHATHGVFAGPTDAVLAGADLPTGLTAGFAAIGGVGWEDPQLRVLTEAMLHATRDPEVRAEMAATLNRFRTELAAMVAKSVAAGRMAPADAPGIALLTAALLDGIALHWLLDPSLDLPRAARAMVTLLTGNAVDRERGRPEIAGGEGVERP